MPPAAFYLIGEGVQVSGYINPHLTTLCFSLAAALLLISLAHLLLEHIKKWKRRNTPPIPLGAFHAPDTSAYGESKANNNVSGIAKFRPSGIVYIDDDRSNPLTSGTINPEKNARHLEKIRSLIGVKRISFDYSTNNSIISVGRGDSEFRLSFGKASNTSIHFYSSGRSNGCNCVKIARVRGIRRMGETLKFEGQDSTSNSYTIELGENFFALNPNGYFLLGKVVSLKDDTRGDDCDEVVFDYAINRSGEFSAL